MPFPSARIEVLCNARLWLRGLCRVALLCVTLPVAESPAAEPIRTAADLVNLELEDLLKIEVTSVSTRPESLAEAPASIYVIRRDDIRRSGATSLVEALRLAPNLQVARTHASEWSVSARGFNNTAANKLLVLIDGRSVYTPLFSGVFWDVQDVMLEDIERIEVVSGPGGTLWGTNAVNGVINVITRSAADTQGGLLSLGGGSMGSDGAFRYGGKLGEHGHYRVYAKYLDRQPTVKASGGPIDDAWHKSQIGFRADWAQGSHRVSVQANAYDGSAAQPAPGTIGTGEFFPLGVTSLSGANLTARWSQRLSSGGAIDVQAYLDRTERTVPPTFAETLDIADLKFQHTLQPIGRHAWAWGAQYRHGRDRVDNSALVAFLPGKVNQTWTSVFAQDRIELGDKLQLTLGARIESNDYTGAEFLPNARLAWRLSNSDLLWSALSRAVRSPSRLDRDTFAPGTPPFLLTGGPDVRSEVAKVVEVGYRGQPAASTSYSVTVFYSEYDHLRSQEIAPSGTSLFFDSQMEGSAYGVELWGNHQASPTWRLSGGLLLLRTDLRRKPGSNDPIGRSALGNDPRHQWSLRSSHDLTPRHELDFIVRRVGKLPNPQVPSYVAVDARLGWHVRKNVEVSLTLQNLFDRSHPEFNPLETVYAGLSAVESRSEYERGVFLKLLWRI